MEHLELEGRGYRVVLSGYLRSQEYTSGGNGYDYVGVDYWWSGCGKVECKATREILMFNYTTTSTSDFWANKWYRECLASGVIKSVQHKPFSLDWVIDRETVVDNFCQKLVEAVRKYDGELPVPSIKIGETIDSDDLQQKGLMAELDGQVALGIEGGDDK